LAVRGGGKSLQNGFLFERLSKETRWKTAGTAVQRVPRHFKENIGFKKLWGRRHDDLHGVTGKGIELGQSFLL